MKKLNFYFLTLCMSFGVLFTACDDDDNNGSGEDFDAKIEEMAMTDGWNNYLAAATSELYDDCVELWAAWAGPDALSAEEYAIVGTTFFTTGKASNFPDGYAYLVKNPGTNNSYFASAMSAVEATIIQGAIDIADEVGPQKIGTPYSYAKAGKTEQAVLEVESWYSWNSITDYSDNIISIRNTYFGGRGNETGNGKSLSDFVKTYNTSLDAEISDAIDYAYTSIKSMDAPFRNNLTGVKVETAIKACSDLSSIYTSKLLPLLETNGKDYNFSSTLEAYADDVVVETYRLMKEKAKALKNAVDAYAADPTNQSKLDAACEAWRATRVPWEESEAFLIGPADLLGLDPSLDSWPLDQQDIYTILSKNKSTSVAQIINAIQGESVRGFHTIELLLFKNGQNRKVITAAE